MVPHERRAWAASGVELAEPRRSTYSLEDTHGKPLGLSLHLPKESRLANSRRWWRVTDTLLAFARCVARTGRQVSAVFFVNLANWCRVWRWNSRSRFRGNSEVGVHPSVHGAVLLLSHHGDARVAVAPREAASAGLAAGGGQGKRRCAREASGGRSAIVADETVLGGGDIPSCAIRAEVTLDLPSGETQLVSAVDEVGGRFAGA